MMGDNVMTGKKMALVGSKGMLASAVRERAGGGWEVIDLDLPEFDMTDASQVEETLRLIEPTVIVNCAAYTNVDGAESDENSALRVNGEGPANLARAAKRFGATLVHISTDYVFDGQKRVPYLEEDSVAPKSAYGRTKLAGEQAILESGLEKFFIIRTSWLYGPGGKNFVETVIRLATEREELRIVADQVGTPTYTVDLAEAIFRLLATVTGEADAAAPYGIYHFSAEGACSWYEFAGEIVAQAQDLGEPIKAQRVLPIKTEDYPLPAQRPAYSVFSKEKYRRVTGAQVPGWLSSLTTYMKLRSH
jgi:dTDP-4-dehydrorhamnose reductase